jgi:cytochrome c553
MRDFRDGRRRDPTMEPMAKPLSDADINDLAAYYSSLR